MGLLFRILSLIFSVHILATMLWLGTGCALVYISIYDAKHRLIPRKTLYATAVLLGVLLLLSCSVHGYSRLVGALSAALCAALLYVTGWATRRSGLGDVKLAAILALAPALCLDAVLPIVTVIIVTFAWIALAHGLTIVGIIARYVVRRTALTVPMAHAPAMSGAVILVCAAVGNMGGV